MNTNKVYPIERFHAICGKLILSPAMNFLYFVFARVEYFQKNTD